MSYLPSIAGNLFNIFKIDGKSCDVLNYHRKTRQGSFSVDSSTAWIKVIVFYFGVMNVRMLFAVEYQSLNSI